MVKIYSLNCKGLKTPHKVALLQQRLEHYKVDICFLQETHVDNIKLAKEIESKLNGKMFWSFTENKGKGVAIFISKSFDCQIERYKYDFFGRYVYVDLDIENHSFRFINVYAPNAGRERKDFFTDLYSHVLCARPVILGGDFNCVANLALDKKGGNPDKGTDGWQELSSIIQDFNLVDSFRNQYPTQQQYTWSNRNISCRLDRFYISSCLMPTLTDVRHILYANSDHKFVAITLSDFRHVKVGKPFWKFNNSLLKDEDYFDFMKAYLYFRLQNMPDESSLLEWWDEVKLGIKQETIGFNKEKAKRQRSEMNCLQKEYARLERQDRNEEAKVVKEKILRQESEKLRGAQIRSKAQLLENGEKPTKFFLRKELQRGKKKLITNIVKDTGEMCTDSKTILNAFEEFYRTLYTEEKVEDDVIDDLLRDVPQLSEDDSKMLGEEITGEEIRSALNSMLGNKSPGSDGLSKEFYLAFFELFCPVFIKMFQTIHTQGDLATSQKLSYISVLCKDDSHPEIMGNYRPISLLNVDYKILTKVLCNRLKTVLGQLIHPDQTCAVPGRSIINNCHLVRDILDFANTRNTPGILLSLDQEKAFDRVSHVYLLRVLKAFGVGKGFTKWIATIYSDIFSCVIVNHFVSRPFPVTRSVRQGCSLSPLLYVLCLEPLLIKIRKDKEICGFKLPGKKEEQKTSAFADDGNFFLADGNSVKRVLYCFEYFGRGSGAKLNRGKSKGHFFGKWKNRSDHPFGISWVDKIKIFGIVFGDVTVDELWSPVYKKICKTLNLYRGRLMSMYGKAVVANTMVLSKLWYMASVLHVPKHFVELIEREIFHFLWNNKNEMINRNTMFLPRDKGGVGIVNIRLKIIALQLSQVCKVVYDDSSLAWVPFGHVWLGLKLIKFKDYNLSNLLPHCVEDIPDFYKSILKHLDMLLFRDPSFPLVSNGNCKCFYKKLLCMKNERPKVVNKFPQIDFSQVFSNLCNPVLDPGTITTSFKLAHDVLPVAYRLYLFGMSVCKMCSFCKKEVETVEHLFYFCSFVQKTKHFLALWFKTIGNMGISLECVRFSVFTHDALSIRNKNALLVLLSEYRFAIWLCRNKARFDNKKIDSIEIAAHFLARIKIRLWTDFQRMSNFNFTSQWVHDTLCEVSETGVKFKFSLNK